MAHAAAMLGGVDGGEDEEVVDGVAYLARQGEEVVETLLLGHLGSYYPRGERKR